MLLTKLSTATIMLFIDSTTIATDSKVMTRKLSQQELRLLTLLKDGCTYDQAAETMGIRPNTVKGYANNLRFKLGASSKSELILAGLRQGLITLIVLLSLMTNLISGDQDLMRTRVTRNVRTNRPTAVAMA